MKRIWILVLPLLFLATGALHQASANPAGEPGDTPKPVVLTNVVIVAGLDDGEYATLQKRLAVMDKEVNAKIGSNPKAFTRAVSSRVGSGETLPHLLQFKTVVIRTTPDKMGEHLRKLDRYKPLGFVLPITSEVIADVRQKKYPVADSFIIMPRCLQMAAIDKQREVLVLDLDKSDWIQTLHTARSGGTDGKGGMENATAVGFASDPLKTFVDPHTGEGAGISPGMPFATETTTTTTTTEETTEDTVVVTTTTTTTEDNSQNTFSFSLSVSWEEFSGGLSDVWGALTNSDDNGEGAGDYVSDVCEEAIEFGMNCFDSNGANNDYL
jgi:hypothetical protein